MTLGQLHELIEDVFASKARADQRRASLPNIQSRHTDSMRECKDLRSLRPTRPASQRQRVTSSVCGPQEVVRSAHIPSLKGLIFYSHYVHTASTRERPCAGQLTAGC